MTDLNRVTLTARLTRDPELKALPDGTSVLSLRVAFSNRARVNGEWTDVPNYVDVSMFGKRAESLSRFLERGKQVGIDGRLRWREWQTREGEKRSTIDIQADEITLLGGKSEGATAPSAAPVYDDSDIPF